jgi:membrane associated rhomboid family serine protease
MIPLRDNIFTLGVPFINHALIILNVLFFLFELSLGSDLDTFLHAFGFVPVHFLSRLEHHNTAGAVIPIFSSMFLHGGWLHLIGNMWTLFIFGDNVEDRLGHFKYLALYVGCGVAACFAQLLSNPSSTMPMVGASGAIAGVMGAYFCLFPGARILTIVPLLFFIILEIPAYVFLGIWFLMQFFFGTFALLGTKAQVGIAFWAHVGGFLIGYLILFLLMHGKPRDRLQTQS